MSRYTAIPVVQPIGEFFLCALPYRLVQKIAQPDTLTLEDAGVQINGIYKLSGTQREEIVSRRKKIGNYISSVEATFPNTIILAANIDENDGILPVDHKARWTITHDEKCDSYHLEIPTDQVVARIIDGQHRVRGFSYAPKQPKDFLLPCAVFLELSMPEQADIFATINSNQVRIDRSLAYNLFAYNLEKEPSESWPPDKLAVFLTRRLSVEPGSPLKDKIKVIARQGKFVYSNEDWHVSTSVVVDGILSLFSKKPKDDRNSLNGYPTQDRMRSRLPREDGSPLRKFYIENTDKLIYTLVFNYFLAVDEIVFQNENRGFMTKTIGLQALFDFLRSIAPIAINEKNISKDFFLKYLKPIKDANLDKEEIKKANAQGRALLRNLMLYANELETPRELDKKTKRLYDEILGKQ